MLSGSIKKGSEILRNPFKKRSTGLFVIQDASEDLPLGYSTMDKNPEVQMAVNGIAGLVASMTIYLMRNTDKGDVREKNELAKKVDIYPYKYMTRFNWMSYIVKNMLVKGNQVVLPIFTEGKIENLKLLKPSEVSLLQNGDDYNILWRGKNFEPDEVLHFVLNPKENAPYEGAGLTVNLKQIVRALGQAQKTKTDFMNSKWKPSLIIRVDAVGEKFRTKEGREELLTDYFDTDEAGKPWIVPAGQIDVEQVKPLSLNDLAINDAINIDKRTVAAAIGVPPFMVGAGEFNKDEYNNFVQTKIMQIAQIIQQTLTAGLLYSPDRYFMFNYRSLYDYSVSEKVSMYSAMSDRLALDRNEFRTGMGLEPREDMEELIGLENYIPAQLLGKQKKLKSEGEK